MSSGLAVLHAPSGHDIQMGKLLRVPTGRPILYKCLPIGSMLKPGPLPPSIQAKSKGQYWSKAHDQRGKNNVEATKAALVLCQVVFHQDKPVFSSAIPANNTVRTAPPSGTKTTPVAQAPAKTATPKNYIPTSIGSGKSNSNRTLPMDVFFTESKLSANRYRYVMSVASFFASDADLGYSGLRNNLPAISEKPP